MSVPTVESHTRVSRYGMVNAFLVQEDDGLTLIDTMIKGSAKKIARRRRRPRRSDRPDRPYPCPRRPHRLARRARRRSPRCRSPDLLPRRASCSAATRRCRTGRARRGQGRLPRGEDEADADDRGRRTGRLARGDRDARPHPGSPRLPRHPRPHALLRRRLLDPVRRLHLGSCEPALPTPLLRDLGQGDRARERDRTPHPRAGGACAGPRPGQHRRARADGRRDREVRRGRRKVEIDNLGGMPRFASAFAAGRRYSVDEAGRAATLPRR